MPFIATGTTGKLTNISWYLKESTPATEFIKEELAKEDSVVITDTARRDTFTDAEEIYEAMEVKLHKVILDKTDIQKEVEEVLKQFTKDNEPPHLFYKQKYYTSGRGIMYAYEKGELEETLGLPPIVVQ